ncbi:MAG TPA: phosphodiester glycosidase family protein [Abditibacteriaceae bacterium]|jgi:hypothetical protein
MSTLAMQGVANRVFTATALQTSTRTGSARAHSLRAVAFGVVLLLLLCAIALLGRMPAMVGRAYTPFVWIERKTVVPDQALLPDSIKVYEGFSSYEDGAPLRAWYVDVDYNDKGLAARSVLSNDVSGKEVASSMAKKVGALVAINGGYFDMSSNPARTFSLVQNDGRVLVPNIAQVTRTGRKYSVTRSAFGIRRDRTSDVAWVAHIPDSTGKTSLYAYDEPVRNTTTFVANAPSVMSPRGARLWDAVDAIGGGPTLISNGQIIDTYENEVFFGAGFPNALPYPRAAIGYTRDNHLILFATDGKQPFISMGLTLARLAEEMKSLGCVEAMNLDGGGSETLVLEGRAINHPSDGRERRITSIFAIVPVAIANVPVAATTP